MTAKMSAIAGLKGKESDPDSAGWNALSSAQKKAYANKAASGDLNKNKFGFYSRNYNKRAQQERSYQEGFNLYKAEQEAIRIEKTEKSKRSSTGSGMGSLISPQSLDGLKNRLG